MTMHNPALKERLSALVAKTGKSRAAVAREIFKGTDIKAAERNFANYCGGREPRDPTLLKRIAEYFDVSGAYLLGFTDNSRKSAGHEAPVKDLLKPVTDPAAVGNGEMVAMIEAEVFASILHINRKLDDLVERIGKIEKQGAPTSPRLGRVRGK
jgi:hypothetical protein